jgi:hypothetical protein
LKWEPDAKSAIVADFFYSNREGALQTSHYNMLRSILYGVLNQNQFFFYHFQPEYRNCRTLPGESGLDDLVDWSYESLKRVLLSLGDHPDPERLYLIIDAVDESNDEDRRSILNLLLNLCSGPGRCVVKVFIASRPVVQLEHRINEIHNFIRLQDETKSDISNFAYSFLKPLNFTGLLDRTKEYIVEHAQGVFLWVQLVKEELLDCIEVGSTEKEIFEFIKSLPVELEDFYERILDKLETQRESYVQDGIRMFKLVLFACRPLNATELRHALGIPDNPNAEFIPSDDGFYLVDEIERRLIHCAGNLLEIRRHDGIITSCK